MAGRLIGVQTSIVDPRDQTWEIGDPTFRVHFHDTDQASYEYELPSTCASQVTVPCAGPDREEAGRTGWSGNRTGSGRMTSRHFTRARRCAIAVLDIVSRKWVATLVSAEETSTQVEVCFLDAALAEGRWACSRSVRPPLRHRRHSHLREALAAQVKPEQIETAVDGGQVPLLLDHQRQRPPDALPHHEGVPRRRATSPNTSDARHTPTDQAWIETLFGHVKGEWPHLEKITEPGDLDSRARPRPNRVQRGHACTPRSATSPPTTSTKAAATPSARHAATSARQGPPTTPRPPPTESRTMKNKTTSTTIALMANDQPRCRINSDTPHSVTPTWLFADGCGVSTTRRRAG